MILAIIIACVGFFISVSSVSADSLVINEFMANPSSGNDWIEIYNPTSSSVDLTDWILVDSTSTMKTLSGTISTSGFVTFDVSTRLNKTSDSIYLKDPTNTIDSYSYTTEPTTDVSIGRSPDGGSWTTLSSTSKGSSNGSASPSPSPSPTPSPTSYFTISGIPPEIDSAQNFTVNINLNLPNNQNTDYYLKGAFKKVSATRYFGMTKVGSTWINYGSDLSSQLKITTNSSGQWSGNIEVQPDVLDNDYEGTGDYVFKVGRYTASGGSSWSNEASIKINAKEVESEGGVIDLSKLSSKSTPEVLSEGVKNTDTLPEEIYSLENYRRSASISSTPSAQPTVVKANKQNLIIPLIGGLLLGSGLGFAVFIFVRKRVK